MILPEAHLNGCKKEIRQTEAERSVMHLEKQQKLKKPVIQQWFII